MKITVLETNVDRFGKALANMENKMLKAMEKSQQWEKKIAEAYDKLQPLTSLLPIKATCEDKTVEKQVVCPLTGESVLVRMRTYEYTIEQQWVNTLAGKVRYLGTNTLSEDGGKKIYNESEIPLNEETPRCDHCGIDRYRKIHHFFAKDDGTVLCVGSTCCEAYFGFDMGALVESQHAMKSVCDDEYLGEKPMVGIIPMRTLISVVYAVGKAFTGGRWISKKEAEMKMCQASKDYINNFLYCRSKSESAKKLKEITPLTQEQVEKYFKALAKWNKKPDNDFESNVQEALFYANGEQKHYVSETTLAGWAIHDAIFNVHASDTEWYGRVGDKIALAMTIQQVTTTPKFRYTWQNVRAVLDKYVIEFGYSGTKVDWETLVGMSVVIKGTIEKHTEFKGVKITRLKRVTHE